MFLHLIRQKNENIVGGFRNYNFVLLVFFFFFKRWNDYFGLISVSSLIEVVLSFLLIAIVFYFSARFLFASNEKAGIFTTSVLSLCFFFFLIKDMCGLIFKRTTRFESELLIFLVFGALLFLILYFTRKNLSKLTFFISISLMIFFASEILRSGYKILYAKSRTTPEFISGASLDSVIQQRLHLPSVYFIILDGYAGSESLLTGHGFTNEAFTDEIKEMGFRVVKDARSNYKSTLYSISSILNGEYIGEYDGDSANSGIIYKKALYGIYKNKTFATFQRLGYRVSNFSPFNIENYPAAYENRFLPINKTLLLFPTFVDDLCGNFPVYYARKTGNIQLLESHYQKIVKTNFSMLDSVLAKSKKKDGIPDFVYTHLLMPHAPYALDSAGRVNIKFLSLDVVSLDKKKAAYLGYLKYTNKVILNFIRKVMFDTKGAAVIVLMSDHGYKGFGLGKEALKFNALNSIYLPSQTYEKWYDGMSHVNQFRNLFSELTDNYIPLLKDSVVN